jgi:AI-2 transport protein TqsA
MTKAAIWAILILASAAVIAGLYVFREILTQLAIALVLWLAIEALAVHIRRLSPKIPDWAATTIAIVGLLSLLGFVSYEVVVNVGAMAKQSAAYQQRLDKLVADIYAALTIAGQPPTVHSLIEKIDLTTVLGRIAAEGQNLASNTIFILIYLGFMFGAAARVHHKLDRIYPDDDDRSHARDVLTAIRRSMAQYLWVQTLLSAIGAALTFLILLAFGLHNALFWAFLVFFLNYIPAIGPVIAVVMPTAFALVQYPTLGPVLAIGGGLALMNFLVGNLVAPRMMGESLNLSALVILISLTFWGQLWGIVGAFLAAPLMVMIMLTLAQFPTTRWLAILLSEDGEPGVPRRARDKAVLGVG